MDGLLSQRVWELEKRLELSSAQGNAKHVLRRNFGIPSYAENKHI